MAQRRHWTVVRTWRESCRNAIKNFSLAGIENYHPEYRGLRSAAGVRATMSLFPNYTFVYVTDQTRDEVVHVKGVEHMFEGPGSIIPSKFIGMLRRCEDERGYIDVAMLIHYREKLQQFFAGQSVRGLYGLLSGQLGRFVGLDDVGLARVSVKLLGRDAVVAVNVRELVGA